MAAATIALFCAVLLGCIFCGISLVYALLAGLLIFLCYGRYRRIAWKSLFQMAWKGVKTIKNILIIFLLIGMLTALWRAAGTIPVIVCYSARLISPSNFLILAFLLNCGVSVLTGTAFGTAATMGVVCMTMANALQLPPVLVGGAILSGVFFGDRCSPVSTSALLVSELTGTDIFVNIRRMLRTALVPTLLSCGVYAVLGRVFGSTQAVPEVQSIFAGDFVLHWAAVLPAAAILLLSAFRVNVRRAMLISIALAAACCLFLQGVPVQTLPRLLVFGYQSSDPALAAMLNGGGICSMLRVGAIVCISSSYAGIFEGTGLLEGIRHSIAALCRRITPFGGLVVTSLIAGAVACNQTLTIMLAHQLCKQAEPDDQTFALDLEDSAVVLSPLIPWSIAGTVPLATVGAPTAGILAACFLYLLPLWRLAVQAVRGKAAPFDLKKEKVD